MAEKTGLFGVDLESQPEFKENPFPLFNMLRGNQPLFEAPMGIRVISRYEDVNRLLRNVKGGMRLSDGTPQLIPETPNAS